MRSQHTEAKKRQENSSLNQKTAKKKPKNDISAMGNVPPALTKFDEQYANLVDYVRNNEDLDLEWDDSRDVVSLKILVGHLIQKFRDESGKVNFSAVKQQNLRKAVSTFISDNDGANVEAIAVWEVTNCNIRALKQHLIDAQRPKIDESVRERFRELELKKLNILHYVALKYWRHVRPDLITNPHNIQERPDGLTSLTFSNYVNEEQLGKVAAKIIDSFRDRPMRPTVCMVNAASGTGKSALLQYCEKRINEKYGETHLALAITFNMNSKLAQSEKAKFDPEDGLLLRIVHRFMMISSDVNPADDFEHFAEKWKTEDRSSDVSLVDVLDEIQCHCERKLIVLIDEPGLNGPEKEYSEERAEATATVTARSRSGNDGGRVGTRESASVNVGVQVRFVFSSLKPLYKDTQVSCTRDSGSPIDWLEIPKPTQAEHELDGQLRQYLSKLGRRMPSRDFDRTLALVKALSSENWAILDDLAKRIYSEEPRGPFDKIVYFQNARDALVQSSSKIGKYIRLSKSNPDMFAQLVSESIWRQECDPFSADYNVVRKGRGKEMVRLVDLAFESLVLNSFPGIGSELSHIIPRVSVFAIREWCDQQRKQNRSSPSGYLSKPMGQVLQWAGHDPEDKEAAEMSYEEPSRSFEKMSANFVLAKLIAWEHFGNGIDAVPLCGTSDSLFPGHFSIKDKNLEIRRPRNVKTSAIEIDGTEDRAGGFRFGGRPRKNHGEGGDEWDRRLNNFEEKARAKPLTFREVSGSASTHPLSEGDVVFPSKLNQEFADYLVILSDNQERAQPILLFVQNKLTRPGAETKLTVNDVVSAVELLIRERSVLYNTTNRCGNQIANLNVPEKNVVLCFSVLRQLGAKDSITFKKNVEGRLKTLKEEKGIEFEGTIVVSEGAKEGAEMFGPSLQNLGLLLSSAAVK